jgi:hypothetical protein
MKDQIYNAQKHGVIAKLIPCFRTKRRISEMSSLLNIPNHVSEDDLHLTVLYSMKPCPKIQNFSVRLPIIAQGINFDIFPSRAQTNNCLVLRVGSDQVHSLHSILKNEYGASHDFPVYQPHLTLSYDYQLVDPINNDLLSYFTNLTFDRFIVEPLASLIRK